MAAFLPAAVQASESLPKGSLGNDGSRSRSDNSGEPVLEQHGSSITTPGNASSVAFGGAISPIKAQAFMPHSMTP